MLNLRKVEHFTAVDITTLVNGANTGEVILYRDHKKKPYALAGLQVQGEELKVVYKYPRCKQQAEIQLIRQIVKAPKSIDVDELIIYYAKVLMKLSALQQYYNIGYLSGSVARSMYLVTKDLTDITQVHTLPARCDGHIAVVMAYGQVHIG